jgi:hypothetical protein
MGIPDATRDRVVNVIRFRMDVNKTDKTEDNRSSRQFKGTWTFWNQASIDLYQQQFIMQIESQGLTSARGGFMRASVLADRIFRRHAFGTPLYTIKAQFKYIGLELGDYISLTHPLLLDFETGERGVTNVICEIIDRQPNYAEGHIQIKVLDTRFMSMTTAWQVALNDETAWPGTVAPTYEMFISENNGKYSDGTPGRTLF